MVTGILLLLIGFTGFDEKDGSPRYDTKESAIERARTMIQWKGDNPNDEIWVQREKVPLWLAHLFRDTPLSWIGYYKISNKG